MRVALIALALCLAGVKASAATLLHPGIYQLRPEAYLQPASTGDDPGAGSTLPAGEVAQYRYEHAVPAVANVRYAFVARDPQAQRNTVVFVTDAAYQYDINSANMLCRAYAFPGWNARSEAQPYCRTNIGTDGSEAALEWTSSQFTVRWKDHKRLLHTEHIPRSASPVRKRPVPVRSPMSVHPTPTGAASSTTK